MKTNSDSKGALARWRFRCAVRRWRASLLRSTATGQGGARRGIDSQDSLLKQRTVSQNKSHWVTPLLAQRSPPPGNSYFWRAATGQSRRAERGHSCPQPLPNARRARICCRFAQSRWLRTGMSNATRIWNLVWRAPASFSHVIAGRMGPSPSPRPSPLGRGSHTLRPSGMPEAPDSRTRCRAFSLSPRERAGVRGNRATELSLPAKTAWARFRSSLKS